MSAGRKKEESQMKHEFETRLALLEQNNTHIYHCLERLEKMNESLIKRFDRLDEKFDHLEIKLDERFRQFEDKINNRLWINMYWTIGGFASVLGILAHSLRWF